MFILTVLIQAADRHTRTRSIYDRVIHYSLPSFSLFNLLKPTGYMMH